ncbi:14894_t:CDS:2 [Entrophospora sp. SA101]|nr:5779_t:CDS:2 [Entrophospora sp. SA101]CAJ0647016.1 2185_t:CDS:2 [Entrophospora sp. SA101]CAJ0748595.1 13023_t:CDS:2 [Entrophospora sp. SA101]CAJ0754916.1 14894_t:CDS:2 [Entrophospora sp. SA101]CAJ0847010.1 1086_t:CDS:2 [Entrophospora sp. SA101]
MISSSKEKGEDYCQIMENKKCILAIGRTGNGKSFTAKIFGANDAIVSDGADSCTKGTMLYTCGDNGFLYIDTQGFDDSEGVKGGDAQTALSILKTMNENGITKLHTILWFVVPETRKLGSLTRQAKFIQSLAQYYDGNVWDNVIIVMKGDTLSESPIKAAEEASKTFDKYKDFQKNIKVFHIFLYEYLNPNTRKIYENCLNDDMLNEMGIFKQAEPKKILNRYIELMKGHDQHLVTILFKEAKCLKCPEKNDPRLTISNCHGETERKHEHHKQVHPGEIYKKHPSGLSGYHLGNLEKHHPDRRIKIHKFSYVTPFHTGQKIEYHPNENSVHPLTAVGYQYEAPDYDFWPSVTRVVTFTIVNPHRTVHTPKIHGCCGWGEGSDGCSYACCKQSKGSIGCKEKYNCCNNFEPCRKKHDCCNQIVGADDNGCETVYNCCQGEVNSEGCRDRYECCKQMAECSRRYDCCGVDFSDGNKGCKEYYSCCGIEVSNNIGCTLVCNGCSRDLDSPGCMEICKICHNDPQKGSCVLNHYKHDFGPNVPESVVW